MHFYPIAYNSAKPRITNSIKHPAPGFCVSINLRELQEFQCTTKNRDALISHNNKDKLKSLEVLKSQHFSILPHGPDKEQAKKTRTKDGQRGFFLGLFVK